MRRISKCLSVILAFSSVFLQPAEAADLSFGCDLELSASESKRPTDVRIAKLNKLTFDPNAPIDATADVIFVDQPLHKSLYDSLDSGYFLAPTEVAWLRPIISFENLMATLPPKVRAGFEEQLAISEGLVRAELKPLSKKDFRKWFQIYDRDRVSQKRGPRRIHPGWSKSIGPALENYQRLFFYDNRTGDLLGGVIFTVNGHVLNVPYEAYKAEAKALKLEIRSFAEVINFGDANRLSTLNYLPDANLFGKFTSMSSLEFKASLGLGPVSYQDRRLVKILNTNILNQDFLIFTKESDKLVGHHFTNRPRDLKMYAPIGLVVHTIGANPGKEVRQ